MMDVKELPKVPKESEVLYLGWMKVGKVQGLQKMKGHKVVVVCGSGTGRSEEEVRKRNGLENIPFFWHVSFSYNGYILYEPRVDGSRGLTRFNTENSQFSQLDKAISDVTESDDLSYYYWSGRRQDNTDQGIYKSKADGSEEELLLPVEIAFSLNYVNGKLYYHNNDEKRRTSVLDPVTLE